MRAKARVRVRSRVRVRVRVRVKVRVGVRVRVRVRVGRVSAPVLAQQQCAQLVKVVAEAVKDEDVPG